MQLAHELNEKQRTKDVILEENVNFASLLLHSDIQKGLAASGFKKPSPIQFKSIPLGRCGFDLVVKSKSGTGKTLVFSTIALETVNPSKEHLQVLILVPTREIAVQIQDVVRNIGRYIDGLSVESFIGGLPIEDDVKKLKHCHIAVGAPGRVKHLINLGALTTKNIRLFVLDEADKLLEPSFQTDINEIYDCLPIRKQIIATSATYPKELDTFLTTYMQSPTHVTSENETPLLLGLKQFVAILKANTLNAVQQMKAKNEILLEIFSKVSFTQCLVFTNYQTRTESVSNFLNQKGWDSSFISAASQQTERLEAIKNLKNFKNRILLSTDLTSRGIDAPNVDLVINYDLPHDAVTYLHRMGRAGRYGSSGICVNFALEGGEIMKLQKILGTIGATNLSISVLPDLGGVDLWKVDPGSLEQIWGVVPTESSNEVSENIKKEVFILKQKKKKKDRSKKENLDGDLLNSLISEKCNIDDDSKKRKFELEDRIQDLLRSKKIEEEEIPTSVETEDLLSCLASGENVVDEESKRRKIDASEDVLTLLMNGDDDDSKKRKRNTLNDASTDAQKEKRQFSTFSKNKALLGISKILIGTSVQIDAEVVDSVGDYLNISKDSDLGNDVSVEDILNFHSEAIDVVPKEEEEDVIEDIFRIGYESTIEGNNWMSFLPREELQNFQDFCREELVAISSESEGEEEEDYNMEEENEDEAQEVEEVQDVALQWVPVESTSIVDNDHFTQCFNDCSNVLWQNGLTFETVPDFDDWYYQWQQHLQSVRSYVQQNIYVQEMSKYQQSRLDDKL